MNYGLTTCLAVATMAGFVSGCHSDEFVASTFQTTFEQQFDSACANQLPCHQAVDAYGDGCFDRKLALDAFKASQPKKRQINSTHIMAFQACIALKAGKDYWVGMNMPARILDKGND